MSAHALLLELARLHKQLALVAAAGSTREVTSLLERIADVRGRIDDAQVGPRCAGCGRLMGRGKRWRTYVEDAADESSAPVVSVYCADCAVPAFGG